MNDGDSSPAPAQRPDRKRGRPRAFNDKTEQNTVKSLDRAVTVLETLARIEQATLSALADQLGQSPATVYRILVTLEARGLVEIDAAAQTWHIGPGAFLIGSAFLRRTSVVQRALPIMRDLMRETGETANLGVWRDGGVLFVSQVETHQAIRAFFPPGTYSPFHASGVGKALASRFDEARLDALFHGRSFERFTARTITAPAALREELTRSATRGYAVDDEEKNIGMRCVAAAVINAEGEAVAGLSISGPISRMNDDDVDRFAGVVTAAARRLSAMLGAAPEGDI
ncbi:MAG: HTH-type transcriptional regulator BhcR [Pseudomonadota bacterium]